MKKTAATKLKVKRLTKTPAKTQFGEGSISPHVKLAAKTPAKTQFGEGSISPYIKLASRVV